MPNWCNNTLTLSHKDPAKVKAAAEAFDEGNLLAHLVPEPDYTITPVAPAYPSIAGTAEATIRDDAWWDWRVQNWGTKWDIGGDGYTADISPDGLSMTVSFDSAWSPPIGAYEIIAELGWTVDAYYYEPGMGFCGIWNGFDEFYDISGMKSDEVEDLLPSTLDEMFAISENMADWEEQERQDEELYKWTTEGAEAKKLNAT